MTCFDGTGHETDLDCPWCNTVMVVLAGSIICPFCGYTETVLRSTGHDFV